MALGVGCGGTGMADGVGESCTPDESASLCEIACLTGGGESPG